MPVNVYQQPVESLSPTTTAERVLGTAGNIGHITLRENLEPEVPGAAEVERFINDAAPDLYRGSLAYDTLRDKGSHTVFFRASKATTAQIIAANWRREVSETTEDTHVMTEKLLAIFEAVPAGNLRSADASFRKLHEQYAYRYNSETGKKYLPPGQDTTFGFLAMLEGRSLPSMVKATRDGSAYNEAHRSLNDFLDERQVDRILALQKSFKNPPAARAAGRQVVARTVTRQSRRAA